ncbi:putative uncharacterized protein [Janthinobacterium agaricidamnosum NBRC 102515 = DSM 9628]|uniref:Uncharacterized protein n=2 Tax=Janthinobacterium agaricidamnosum TaxID=55508 RepID=W0V9M2_9BURK|nr:putative uncharacterized protein [Janthinobacterium agaricidamnosum NBRC 102515 = DSM 9628]
MEASAAQAGLAGIARAIADPLRPLESLIGEAGQLRSLVEQHTRLSMAASDHMTAGERILESGWAISPVQAGLCAREPLRSAAFIKGLAAAIGDALTGHAPVSVLYAGCGPFALLALPLMAIFSPQQVQFTILEVHPETLAYARELIEGCGYGGHVREFVCADAALYRIPAASMPQVIVSETMNTALGKEPQVAIMRNLFLQAPLAALVPTAVSVHLGLPGRSRRHPCADWGEVFTLNASNMRAWRDAGAASLPAASIKLPTVLHATEPRLLTRIQVYRDIVLSDYDCSLNLPLRLPGKPLLAGAATLHFHYRLGRQPGLVCEVGTGKA